MRLVLFRRFASKRELLIHFLDRAARVLSSNQKLSAARAARNVSGPRYYSGAAIRLKVTALG